MPLLEPRGVDSYRLHPCRSIPHQMHCPLLLQPPPAGPLVVAFMPPPSPENLGLFVSDDGRRLIPPRLPTCLLLLVQPFHPIISRGAGGGGMMGRAIMIAGQKIKMGFKGRRGLDTLWFMVYTLLRPQPRAHLALRPEPMSESIRERFCHWEFFK